MSTEEAWKNKLYFGDNLDILREHITDESVDLIYLDPPFNSNATYNVLFEEKDGSQSQAQIAAFDDTWHWGQEAEATFREIVTESPKSLADVIQAFRSFLGQNDMMAYLVMMAIRLVELHRVLKPTGSIYLHCDPKASHYLKLMMDAVFGARNFRNEIIWTYRTGGVSEHYFARKHQVLLFYSKTNHWHFIPLKERTYIPTLANRTFAKEKLGAKVDDEGCPNCGLKGQWSKMSFMRDVWEVRPLRRNSRERLGYPTQKPEALLERIIMASSKDDDIILDPFCGCGTTINVAERLKRQWVGIDITHLAIALMRYRLNDTFGPELSPYEVWGAPGDLEGAKALAELDRYQFEWWALSLIDARPAHDKKKGADKGIDGYIYFFDDESGIAKKIIVQVKSGHVTRNQIGDLIAVVDREKAVIGVFITLESPTKPMKDEALAAGYYAPEYLAKQHTVPKIQIVTIAELLSGAQVQYPRMLVTTFKKAERKYKDKGPAQGELL